MSTAVHPAALTVTTLIPLTTESLFLPSPLSSSPSLLPFCLLSIFSSLLLSHSCDCRREAFLSAHRSHDRRQSSLPPPSRGRYHHSHEGSPKTGALAVSALYPTLRTAESHSVDSTLSQLTLSLTLFRPNPLTIIDQLLRSFGRDSDKPFIRPCLTCVYLFLSLSLSLSLLHCILGREKRQGR